MQTVTACPEWMLCQEAGLLYERIVTATRSPTTLWAVEQAIRMTSARFPPAPAVTDREWLARMRLLADVTEHAR